MKKVCDLCGWEYNEEEGYPEGGIAPGTKWEDIPDDFVCPLPAAMPAWTDLSWGWKPGLQK